VGLKYLLDTNVLSEVVKKQPDSRVLSKLEEAAGQYCTCVTVWHELHHGVALLQASKRKSGLLAYLESLERGGLPVLPYEKSAALWLAGERARLSKRGFVIPYMEGEIAAVAVDNQLVLVTRNVLDFKGFNALKIENWFSA
jgi:tRNA(fMet)-specific endonuclease VapC